MRARIWKTSCTPIALLRHRTAAFISDLMHTELKGLKINEIFLNISALLALKKEDIFDLAKS